MQVEHDIDGLEQLLMRKPIGNSMKREEFSLLSLGAMRSWRRNRHLDMIATTAINGFDFKALFLMMDEGYTMTKSIQAFFEWKVCGIFKHFNYSTETDSFQASLDDFDKLRDIEYGITQGHFKFNYSYLYMLLSNNEIPSRFFEASLTPFTLSFRQTRAEFTVFGQCFQEALSNQDYANTLFKIWIRNSLENRNDFSTFSYIFEHQGGYFLANVSKDEYLKICRRIQNKGMYAGVNELFQKNMYFYEQEAKEVVQTKTIEKHFSRLPLEIQQSLMELKNLYRQIHQQHHKHEHIITTDYGLIYKKALEQVITYNKIDDNMLGIKNVQGKTPDELLLESLTEAQTKLYEIVLGINEEHVSQMSVNNRMMKGI